MKRTRAAGSAPAEKTPRPYANVRLQGTQRQCAQIVTGLARVFGAEAIGTYGRVLPRPRHGPDHVSVHIRVTPGTRRPRRRLLPRRRRKAGPDVAAQLVPVSAEVGGAKVL